MACARNDYYLPDVPRTYGETIDFPLRDGFNIFECTFVLSAPEVDIQMYDMARSIVVGLETIYKRVRMQNVGTRIPYIKTQLEEVVEYHCDAMGLFYDWSEHLGNVHCSIYSDDDDSGFSFTLKIHYIGLTEDQESQVDAALYGDDDLGSGLTNPVPDSASKTPDPDEHGSCDIPCGSGSCDTTSRIDTVITERAGSGWQTGYCQHGPNMPCAFCFLEDDEDDEELDDIDSMAGYEDLSDRDI